MPQDRALQIQQFILLLNEYIGFITDLPADADFDGHFILEETINAKAVVIGFMPIFVREEVWRDSGGALAGWVQKRIDDIEAAVMDGRTHPATAEGQLRELEQQYRAELDLRVCRPHDIGFTVYYCLPVQRFCQRQRAGLIAALREWQRAARTKLVDPAAGEDTTPLADLIDAEATPLEKATPARASARPKLPKDEANIKAREYLKQHFQKHGKRPTVAELVKAIGCSTGQVSNLPAWRAVMDQERKGRQVKKSGVVNLTPKMERAVGAEDDSLAKLIREQHADAEPSPLEDDAPSRDEGSPRTAKVYRRP